MDMRPDEYSSCEELRERGNTAIYDADRETRELQNTAKPQKERKRGAVTTTEEDDAAAGRLLPASWDFSRMYIIHE
jgi:hypothetical protein